MKHDRITVLPGISQPVSHPCFDMFIVPLLLSLLYLLLLLQPTNLSL
jgi:hypothetical protein